jgi:exodeoxyribonuclease V alpha subunit
LAEVITATVSYIIYQKDNFYIIEIDNRLKAKGHILDTMSTDITGMTYRFEGYRTKDKYGEIFVIEKAEMLTHNLYFFLTKIVKGIGDKLAMSLLDAFGDNLEFVIENEPEKLLNVPGIKGKKQQKIVEEWHKYSHLKKLSEYLGKYNISSNIIAKIYKELGENSVEIIQQSPYLLTTVSGIGFKKADQIALQLGVDKNSEDRFFYCALYVLEKNAFDNGHTYLNLKDFIQKINEQLNTEWDINETTLSILNNNPEIFINDNKVALTYLKHYEESIFEFTSKQSSVELNYFNDVQIENHILEFENQRKLKLSDKQKEAVRMALNYRIFALTGYAGTGKSTISYVFLTLLNKVFENEIVGCAISGIAARRLSQLTGFPAYTIHSLLKYDGENFEHGQFNKLDYKVIVLDEAAMVNSFLFYHLLSAMEEDTIFIMIGDDAQLPPIGPGNVFSDIIKYNLVPSVKLDFVFRQSQDSVINYFANYVRKGEIPKDYKSKYKDWLFQSKDLTESSFSRSENNLLILKDILDISKFYLNKGLNKTLNDFQVLAPQKKGILGVENLNIELQQIFNDKTSDSKNFIKINGKIFCLGDKVVHLKNIDMEVSYKDTDIDNFSNTERIFNGTLGTIIDIDKKDRCLKVQTITDLIVNYDFDDLNDLLDLAYALTVHKAQGSEFKYVIIPLTKSNTIMLDNQWLYTAITRAKRGLVICGEPEAFEYACKNVSKKIRNTWIDLICKKSSINFQ